MNVRTGITAGGGTTAFQSAAAVVIDSVAYDPPGSAPAVEQVKQNATVRARAWELDALRGFAILLMLLYHLLLAWFPAWQNMILPPPLAIFLLTLMEGALLVPVFRRVPAAGFPLPEGKNARRAVEVTALLVIAGLLFLLGSIGSGAGMFLVVSGMTLALVYERARLKGRLSSFRSRTTRRALQVLAAATLVSLLSWLILPTQWVYYGALHMIGTAMLFSLPFLGLPAWALLLSGFALAAVAAPWRIPGSELGRMIPGLGIQATTNSPLVSALFPLAWRSTIDYYPLLPSFGFLLAGAGAGKLAIQDGKFSLGLPNFSETRIGRGLQWLGKNALQVYMAQEVPALLGFALHSM